MIISVNSTDQSNQKRKTNITMANPFLIIPINPSNPSAGYKFILAKNESGKSFTTAKDPTQLPNPEITKTGDIITIQPVENATSYHLYQDNEKIGETNSLTNAITFNLTTIVYPKLNGKLKVKAHDDTGMHSDSNFTEIEGTYPSTIAPTPTASEITLTGASLTINNTCAYNKVTLTKESETGYNNFTTAQNPIDLRTIKNSNNNSLSAGTYSVNIQCAQLGKALSLPYNAGDYERIIVKLDTFYWDYAQLINVRNDGGI